MCTSSHGVLPLEKDLLGPEEESDNTHVSDIAMEKCHVSSLGLADPIHWMYTLQDKVHVPRA